MEPVIPKADPAPSVLTYRLTRLWLRPTVRTAVLKGLPICAAIAAVFVWAGDPDRRTTVMDAMAEVADTIRARPEFAVTQMRIEGADAALQGQIQTAAAVTFPVSRFDLDTDAMVARLEALDPIHDAEIGLRAGGTLLIRVTERRAVVAHRSGGQVIARDATGHRVATLKDTAAAGALPLIAGDGAQDHVAEALALTRAAAPLRDELIGLVRVGMRRWDVILSNDRRILLPERAPLEALDRALAMQAAKDVLNRDIAILDMRMRRRPVLRMSARALDEMRRMRSGSATLTAEVSR